MFWIEKNEKNREVRIRNFLSSQNEWNLNLWEKPYYIQRNENVWCFVSSENFTQWKTFNPSLYSNMDTKNLFIMLLIVPAIFIISTQERNFSERMIELKVK